VPSAASAPSTRPARGPYSCASQPTSGAPIGVEPRNTTEYSDITRPREGPSAASCSEEFTPAANVTLAAPSGARTSACASSVGAAAAASSAAPNSSAEPASSRGVTRLRAPAASAPQTEPMPIAVVSSA
jgi:hypothetical protein